MKDPENEVTRHYTVARKTNGKQGEKLTGKQVK